MLTSIARCYNGLFGPFPGLRLLRRITPMAQNCA